MMEVVWEDGSMAQQMHPQKRAQSAMRRLVEVRRGSASYDEANDWLDRGWNPFLRQEKASWHDATPAIEIMEAEHRWCHWMSQRKDVLAERFASAYPKMENGLSNCSRLLRRAAPSSYGVEDDFLHRLLEWGADPNATRASGDEPVLNIASLDGAKALLKAGASAQRVEAHPSAWEAWAQRCAKGDSIAVEDLDWMAQACPPDASHPEHLPGAKALCENKKELVVRIRKLGVDPEVFGLGTPLMVSRTISKITRRADNAGILEEVVNICGADKALAGFVLKEPGQASALEHCLFDGRVRCLGVMEKVGLLSLEGCSALELSKSNAGNWAANHSSGLKMGREPAVSGTPSAAGAIWSMSRIPSSQIEQARSLLAIFVSANPMIASRLAKSCAGKGMVAERGPHSLQELYKHGALWKASTYSNQGSFAAFAALCDQKLLKKTLGKALNTKAKQRL